MRRLRLRFWLFVLDALCLLPRGFGSALYYRVLARASDATDWGPGVELGDGGPSDV